MTRQFDDVLLGSIELFCSVVELGSFTAAANAAAITPAAVSRAISRLEARLDVRLFVRATRTLHLTDAGRAYFEHCRARPGAAGRGGAGGHRPAERAIRIAAH